MYVSAKFCVEGTNDILQILKETNFIQEVKFCDNILPEYWRKEDLFDIKDITADWLEAVFNLALYKESCLLQKV